MFIVIYFKRKWFNLKETRVHYVKMNRRASIHFKTTVSKTNSSPIHTFSQLRQTKYKDCRQKDTPDIRLPNIINPITEIVPAPRLIESHVQQHEPSPLLHDVTRGQAFHPNLPVQR